jgi:ribosome-interacting GTPase 1
MMPLAIFFAKNLGKRLGKVQTEAGEISGNLTSFLSEIFKAAKMIRIYQKEQEEKANSYNVINALVKKILKLQA